MLEEIVKNHRMKEKDLIAIADGIEKLYDTRHSLSYSGVKLQPGKSTVERAIEKIDNQREYLADQMENYFKEDEEIEKWLAESVKNQVMKTIIRARFLNGKSWKETSRIIYGRYAHEDQARDYYRRHKHEIYEQ